MRDGVCEHLSYDVLIFEPVEWQKEGVTHMVQVNERTGETVLGGTYSRGYYDICMCLDCGRIDSRRGLRGEVT